MRKLLITALCSLLIFSDFEAQTNYNVFTNDNYAAPFGSTLNPASLADNRYKWAVGFGGNYTYSNNYIGTNFNQFIHGERDRSYFRKPGFNGYYSELIEATAFTGFLEITPTDAVGYSIKYKQFTNFDGIAQDLTELDFYSFTNSSTIGEEFNQGRLSYSTMTWVEHNLTYSRTLIDKKKKFLKAGLMDWLGRMLFSISVRIGW